MVGIFTNFDLAHADATSPIQGNIDTEYSDLNLNFRELQSSLIDSTYKLLAEYEILLFMNSK